MERWAHFSISLLPVVLSFIRQPVQQVDAEDHHQQTDRHNDEQRESKPTQHHGAGAYSTSHTAVSEVLRNLSGGNRCCVLP